MLKSWLKHGLHGNISYVNHSHSLVRYGCLNILLSETHRQLGIPSEGKNLQDSVVAKACLSNDLQQDMLPRNSWLQCFLH